MRRKKYPDKSFEEMAIEFERYGYVLHICPHCGEECNPTEVDNTEAICEICDKLIKVKPVI